MEKEELRLRWNAFIEEYSELFRKYPEVDLDWGCGCCSYGHRIADVRVSEEVYGGVGWSDL